MATIKAIGGVILTNVSGALSDSFGERAVFLFLLAASAAGLAIALLIRPAGEEKALFQAAEDRG